MIDIQNLIFSHFYPAVPNVESEYKDVKTPLKIDTNFKLPENIDDLLKYSDAKSQLNPIFDREGVVIRSLDRKVSFKVISNKFLLNEK
jgi:hypothetical protein